MVAVVLFSFVLTFLIAAIVQAVVGLREPRAAEGQLDQRQQAAAAYHLSGVPSLSGAGAPQHEPPQRPDGHLTHPAIPPGKGVRLVTALLDPRLIHTRALQQALVEAGASSIVASESAVSVEDAVPQVVRGYRWEVDLVSRIRVDVLVSEPNAARVTEVLARYNLERTEGFVQTVEPIVALRNPGKAAD